MDTRAKNEQIRKLEAKSLYFRYKVRVYDDAFFEYQFDGNKTMADFCLKSIKAYEDALKACLERIAEVKG